VIEKVMPADGMSAAAEKGTSARPVGQLGVRLPYSCKWRKWLCCMSLLLAHRDILHCRVILVAFGLEADITGRERDVSYGPRADTATFATCMNKVA